MRKIYLVLLVALFISNVQGQIFHEDFEFADSVTYSGFGASSWSQNSRLHASGSYCDSASIIDPGDIVKMTTIPFSTDFIGSVFLYFNHICKVEFFEEVKIEASLDGGVTWVPLIDDILNPNSNCYYLGSGLFGFQQSRFSEASYSTWQPGNNILPDSTWWVREVFDVSAFLAYQPDVRLRFVLTDANNNGGAGRAGWYIDDILVSDSLNFNFNPLSNLITGNVFVDFNSNLVMDGSDVPVDNYAVYTTDLPQGLSTTDSIGNYAMYVQQTDSVFFKPYNYGLLANYWNVIPLIDTAVFAGFQQTDSLNNFAFQPAGNFDDLGVYMLYQWGVVNPGKPKDIYINYYNQGTTIQNPTVVMYYDTSLTYMNTTGIQPSQITSDSIVWNLTGVNPMFQDLLKVTFMADSTLTVGTFVNTSVHIYPISSDVFPVNNVHSIISQVLTSFDPNFISVQPEIIYTPELAADPVLEYTIHFQNTGNDVAYYIRIDQSIPPEWDMSTYELIASSHNVTLFNNGVMRYTFNNIMLPDSTSDPEGSQGFITFRVRPKPGLAAGDSISTVADIYFDYNLAVTTNTALTVIQDPLSIAEGQVEKGKLKVFPNPANDEITIQFYSNKSTENSIDLFNLYGQQVKSISLGNVSIGEHQQKLDVSDLSNGIYLIRLENGGASSTSKFVKIGESEGAK